MSFQGFECPLADGRHVLLKDCVECPFPCMELPMLVSIWGDGPRNRKEGRHSVTAMTRPTKSIILETVNDYWVNPFSMVKMTIGTLFHAIMEGSRLPLAGFDRKDRDFEFEKKFEHVMDLDGEPATLVGKSDQYQFSTLTLTDYKATGTYTYEKALKGDFSGYDVQCNLYRKYQYPQAERMQLAFWLTDWGARQRAKGIRPFERVEVPYIPDDVLEDLVITKIRAITAGLKDPAAVAPCTDAERWWNGKTYNRCAGYCNAAPFCNQFHAMSKGEKYD